MQMHGIATLKQYNVFNNLLSLMPFHDEDIPCVKSVLTNNINTSLKRFTIACI